MKPFLRRPDTLAPLLLGAGALVVYLRTMSPGVGTEDPGELAAVLHTLGIAHPTGYPLFTMLGSLFVRVLPGEADIGRMNLFGALLTALSVVLFHGAFRRIFSAPGRALFGDRRRSAEGGDDGFVAAGAATIVYAFSAIVWFEAVSIEVYALHLVFLALVTRLLLTALASPGSDRKWLLFAYVLGLSFAHHMMTVLLAPAFLWLYFRNRGFGRAAWSGILKAVPPFLLALSAYLYLPIRAASNPLMNWGDPSTPSALWKHVTAGQYGGQMFSSWEIAARKLAQFAVDLPADFGWPALVLAAAGLIMLSIRARGLLIFSLLVFATGLFYAVNYAFDDPNFHLHPHFAVALWAGGAGGGGWILLRGRARLVVRILLVAAVLSTPVLNLPRMDKSRDTLVEDYARNMLASADTGAVLFSNEYERFGSPAFYLQNVKGFREDVGVLDIILLGNPWYYAHLEQRVPWLMEDSRNEIDAYRAELDRLIAGTADTATHNARLADMFYAIVERSLAAGRPVYVTSGINLAMLDDFHMVPSGMLFRLIPENDSVPYIPPRDFDYARPPSVRVNRLSDRIRVEYAEGYANQGAHLLRHGDTTGAADRFRKALAAWPAFPAARELLRSVTP